MNDLQKRRELEHKVELFGSAKTFEEASQYAKYIPEYMNLLSYDISNAIGIMKPSLAPYILAVLRNYVKNIEAQDPGTAIIANNLQEMDTRFIKVAVPDV